MSVSIKGVYETARKHHGVSDSIALTAAVFDMSFFGRTAIGRPRWFFAASGQSLARSTSTPPTVNQTAERHPAPPSSTLIKGTTMFGKCYFNSIGRSDRSRGVGVRYGKDWPQWAKNAYWDGWLWQTGGCT